MTKAQNNNCNISDISGFFPDDARTHQKPRDEPPSTSLTLEDTKDSSGVQATINPSSASSSYVQNLQAHTVFTHHELFFICSQYLKNRRGSKTVTSVSDRTDSRQRCTTFHGKDSATGDRQH